MANHKSAKKRIRRNDKFQLINKIRKTRVRTFIKKVENFIEEKDKKNAQLAFVEAQPEMHRSVAKGVFKRNTISRKLSRLSNKDNQGPKDVDITLDNLTGSEFATLFKNYLSENKISKKDINIAIIGRNPEKSKHLETATMKVGNFWIDFVNLRILTS